MELLPENVDVYIPKHSSKIHFQPTCAGGSAEKEKIHETKFLEKLESGGCCKVCIPQPEMINFTRNYLKKKEEGSQ